MKNLKTVIFAILLSVSSTHIVHATSLDELYRDIVKSDNKGYLPLFVKNRNAPDFLEDEKIEVPKETQAQINAKLENELKVVKLENERKIKEQAILAEKHKWQKTVDAIKTGQITPIELEEVEKRVNKEDLHALEIYAWMNAKGVGVKQNLLKAFNLYQQLAHLNAPNASKNAALVYRSMTREQRESLTSYKPQSL